MEKSIKEAADLHFKKMVLHYAEMCGRDVMAYRLFNVNRSTFYEWKKRYREEGYKGLLRKKADRSSDPNVSKKMLFKWFLNLEKNNKLVVGE